MSRLPVVGHGDGGFALAAVQVTVFTIDVSIHHVACDDSSYMHFVKTWAGHCRLAASVEGRSWTVPSSRTPEGLPPGRSTKCGS